MAAKVATYATSRFLVAQCVGGRLGSHDGGLRQPLTTAPEHRCSGETLHRQEHSPL